MRLDRHQRIFERLRASEAGGTPMLDFHLMARFKLGEWMLRKSMDVMPRCSPRDNLLFAIVSAYAHENGES